MSVLGCSSTGTSPDGGADAAVDGTSTDATLTDAADACDLTCSLDGQAVMDCSGHVTQQCTASQGCDTITHTCVGACQAAANNRQSIGCDFYATDMETDSPNLCFAAYVVNTSALPVHISAEYYAGTPLTVANFARIPAGIGPTLTYSAYDSINGLPPGGAAILFLSGTANSMVPCPTPSAIPSGPNLQGTGKGRSFHITTDLPVATYQINPFNNQGGGELTGASLLLPTNAWDTNYLAVTAAPSIDAPSLNIVASKDNTQITIRPSVAIVGGGTLAAGAANTQYVFTLNAGEQAQLSQQADLTGSIIQSTNPIGLMAGNACMQQPAGVSYCDHGEQMLPPVKAIGSEYVGVMFRPRVSGDQAIWRLVGLVDGTQLTYSASVGGPATLNAGQSANFDTPLPFTVASQDKAHPFLLFANMSGNQWVSGGDGYGDPDFVLVVPPAQFRQSYTFFTDPTFPENDLVVVRAKDATMTFDDVNLDCAGTLAGWQSVGAYEWTRIDLVRHNFQNQGNCSSGVHTMTSKGPFGVTIWGWGSPETSSFTSNVSYGYPAGMSAAPVNSVVLTTQ